MSGDHAMSGMAHAMMQPVVWTPGYVALMFAMWWVMMAAMMLPSAAPMLLLFARIHRGERAGGRSYVPTGIFAWVSCCMGRVQRACDSRAMGSAVDRSAVADDGDLKPAARCRNPDRRGSLAAHADQAHLPAALPLAAGVSRHKLAAWEARCLPDGT